MDPRRLATMASWQAVVLPACVAIWLLVVGSPGTEDSGVAPVLSHAVPSLTADAHLSDPPPPAAQRNADVANGGAAMTGDLPRGIAADTTLPSHELEPQASHEPEPPAPHEAGTSAPDRIVMAALSDPAETLPDETPPAQTPPAQTPLANTPTAEPANAPPPALKPNVGSVEVLDECFVVDACVDRYLWALYQRTPKEDSVKEQEQRSVTVKRKGKMVTVTRTFTTVVDEDFAWKDPKAAEKAGMSIPDYVIGGVDPSFKLKLFHMLLAAEQAGLSPGITSAFRDDYRQSIASGLKAADNRSYHGGSLRGGYGHGLAADVVSTNGETRAQRSASTEIFWKWIDLHGKEFGIGRPYLDHDPPHVAPIDGKEYADHNGGRRTRQAQADVKKKHSQVAARDDRHSKKHDIAKPKPKVRTAAR